MFSASKSFSKRLSLSILLFSSVLFVTSFVVTALISHALISNEAKNSAGNLLKATISDIEKTLLSVEKSVEDMAWIVESRPKDSELYYRLTQELLDRDDLIIGSAIAFRSEYFEGKHFNAFYSYVDSESGQMVSMPMGSPQYDYFYMDWYQIPSLSGEPSWCEPYYDDGGGNSLMTTYSYPLKDSLGVVYAILTADISIQWMSDLLSEIKPYPNSYVTLTSRTGAYLTNSTEKSLSGETLMSTAIASGNARLLEITKAILRGEHGVRQYSYNGNVSFVVFDQISNGWSASIICQYRDVLQRAMKMNGILILIVLLGLLALFLISYYSIRHLTKPLLQISDSAMNIAKGDFNTELPEIKTEDEIRQLRDSFDYMQHSLTAYIDELQTTTAVKQRMESELSIASKIQMAMLPADFPQHQSVDLHALLIPAREVGGDLYDFFIKDNYLYFCVGDVSGKGIPASMFMAITRAAYHFIAKMDMPLDQTIGSINDSVNDGNSSNMFVTLVAGRIQLETGEFEYCNAGHNPMVVIDPQGQASFLDVKPNLAIGVFSGFPYQLQKGHLEKGSRILIYTDGVTEAERADKAQYGEDRLIRWASSLPSDSSAEADCASLMDDVRLFTEGSEQNDDITIMMIKFQ